MLRKEMKIVLPFYKIAFSGCFIFILSLVRGVAFTDEVGIAMEPPLAILAAVFCADTCTQEVSSKRSEIQRLCPEKNRMRSLYRRLAIQEIYLLLMAFAGYALFLLFQRPASLYGVRQGAGREISLFAAYGLAEAVTAGFWGLLSVTAAALFRNQWAGIGGCVLLWILTDSTAGEQYLGKWNLFSYTFRNVEDSGDFSWICGKWICILLGIAMLPALRRILKKL